MDLVLRIIEGPDQGQVFPVPPGSHVIGRGNRAALKLTPEDISWEHAIITREGDDYFIENLSALGTWVGDAKVAGRVKLRLRDRIRLSGEAVLRIEPVGGGGLLSSRAFLGGMLLVVLALGVAALFFSGEFNTAGPEADDWNAAYRTLAPWLQTQANKGRIAPEAVELFDRAWRLEQSEDYEGSQKLWVRLQILLAGADKNLRSLERAGRESNYQSLVALLRPDPKAPASQPSDERLSAAMAQFVERRLKYAMNQTKGGILKG